MLEGLAFKRFFHGPYITLGYVDLSIENPTPFLMLFWVHLAVGNPNGNPNGFPHHKSI